MEPDADRFLSLLTQEPTLFVNSILFGSQAHSSTCLLYYTIGQPSHLQNRASISLHVLNNFVSLVSIEPNKNVLLLTVSFFYNSSVSLSLFYFFSKKNSFVSFVVFTETVYVFLSCSIFPLAWVIPLNKCQTYLLWDLLQDSIWQCISVDNQQNQHGNVWSSLIAAASPIRRAWRCDLNRRSSLKKTKIGSRQIVGDYYNFLFVSCNFSSSIK